jgi:acyl-CoA synthetase (NDP forming)
MSRPLARDLVDVAATTNKPVFVVWGSPVGTEPAYTEVLLASQLPVFRTFGNCVGAVRAYLDYWGFVSGFRSPIADAPSEPRPAVRRVYRVLNEVAPGGTLSELASKRVVQAYGVKPSRDRLCATTGDAVEAADRLGYPVVLKASSAVLTHKSDLGLVAVGVSSAKEVRSVFSDLMARAKRAVGRRGSVDGILVSEMIRGGVEMVVGIAQDPLFGPVVLCGLGGIFVEVLGDVSFRVPPFDRDEAARMVRELRGFPLLEGVRGAKPADLEALLDVIMNVERLALDLAGPASPDGIAELDINPLIVRPRGAVALDALVVRK